MSTGWGVRFAALLRRMMLPSVIYVGDGVLLARLPNGMFIYLDGQDVSLTPSLAFHGTWEPWVAKHFEDSVRDGMRVVDIGANCGYYALLAARRIGAKGEVIAIDVNPRLTGLMGRSFAVNGLAERAKVICGAVWDSEGELEFGLPDMYLGSTSVLIRPETRAGEITMIRTKAAPLSAFLGDNPRVDVLKIDAEGSEPKIWRGAADIIAQNPNMTVFMEFAPPMIVEYGPPGEFLTSIRAAGFSIEEITPHGILAHHDNSALQNKDWAELRLIKRTG